MIDHISIRVADYERSKQFYVAALAPLGFTLMMESDSGAGFRKGMIPSFWVKQGEVAAARNAHAPADGCGGPATHIAFSCDDRAAVDAFYAAAMAAGGRDNGGSGPRPQYHPGYYGAFVLDPDGYNIEAVCHRPA